MYSPRSRGSPSATHRRQDLVNAQTDPDFGLPVSRARHLDAIYPPHDMEYWIRLDHEARTGLIEFRYATLGYPSL